MRIDAIHIRNTATILRSGIDPCGNMHIFVGPNESGKTNILNALTLPILPPLQNARGFDNADIEIRLNHDGRSFVERLRGPSCTPSSHIRALFERHLARLSISSPFSLQRVTTDIEDFRSQYPNDWKEFWPTIRRTFPHLGDHLVHLHQAFDTSPIDLRRVEEAFFLLGDGFRQVLLISLYLLNPRYHVLVLDEPETHIHPSLIKRLRELCQEVSDTKQVFMSTHSPIFIDPSRLHHVYRVRRDPHAGTTLSSIHGTPLHISVRLEQELNADSAEIFFADTVIIVEGVSDRLLLRGLLDRFYRGEKDIKIVYAEGKTNVDIYVQLCKKFNIPYNVVLDHDALTGHPPVCVSDVLRTLRNATDTVELNSALRKEHILVLGRGTIEQHYPKAYQRRSRKKPHNALIAGRMITAAEFASVQMSEIRGLIESL